MFEHEHDTQKAGVHAEANEKINVKLRTGWLSGAVMGLLRRLNEGETFCMHIRCHSEASSLGKLNLKSTSVMFAHIKMQITYM